MRHWRDFLADLILIFIISFGLTMISFLFVEPEMTGEVFLKFMGHPLILIYNFLPILSVTLFIYFLVGRLWLTLLISSVAIVGMGITNVSKLFYREENFKIIDIALIKEAKVMVDSDFKIQFPDWIYFAIVVLLLLVLCLIFSRAYVLKIKHRFIGLVLSLVLFVGVLKLTNNNEVYYENKVDGFNRWIDVENSKAHGMVYAFMHSYSELSLAKPDGYDENLAKKIWNKYEDKDIEDGKKINIIAIMFESFNDFSKYDIDFQVNPYEAYNEVKANSLRGSLIVDVFGGGTVNTERTFLMGAYNQPRYNRPTNSYVWYLRGQGYDTVAMHPHIGTFYNRINVNRNLGFHKFYYDENYFNNFPKKNYYLQDVDLFEHLLRDYKKHKMTGNPYFNMTVTMQNHGPYDKADYVTKYIPESRLLDKDTYCQVNHYFDGIKRSSEALLGLLEKLKDDEEPVIVFAFGDHNPFLGKDNIGFEAMGLDISLDNWRGYLNRYRVPYIIWANESAREITKQNFIGDGPTMSPQYLLNYAFQLMNIEGPKYMQIKNKELSEVSVYNKSYTKEGNDLFPTNEDRNTELREKINSLDYYYNTNYLYKDKK